MECLTDQLASSGRTLLVEGGAAEGMHLDIDLLFPRFCIIMVLPAYSGRPNTRKQNIKTYLMASLRPVSHCIYALIDGMDSG